MRLHVGDVRHPQDVRRERSEMPIHPVHRTLILGCGPGSVRALCPPDAADTHGSLEALHRAAGDMTCPMVCASLGPVEHDVHLPSAEGLIVLLINPADLPPSTRHHAAIGPMGDAACAPNTPTGRPGHRLTPAAHRSARPRTLPGSHR